MIETIYKGIIIGIIISAPMGPTGILCVQRTLNRGRFHGFVTGLGAILSDLIYASITLVGMGIVDNILNSNEQIIQYFGSVVIIIFGIIIFNTNPLKILTPPKNTHKTRYKYDFFTSFLLTLSNITIVFLFISLYTRFHFNPLDTNWFSFAVGLASIGLGALLWWFLVTTYVSKLKRYFNRRSLKIFNRIVGSIFIILGVVGLFGVTLIL